MMYGISVGHGVKHFGQGAVLILVPEFRSALSISDVGIGAMFGARDASSGLTNVPAGLLTDTNRRRVPLLLTISMAAVALGYVLIGISSWYWLTLVALMVIGAGTSLWHAPAFSELAIRYPERRGYAMAIHSTGAQFGNTTAPIAIGLLLGGVSYLGIEWGGLDWRVVAMLLVIPAATTAVLVASMLRPGDEDATPSVSLSDYVTATGRLLRNQAVLAQALLHALRGAAHNSIQLFLVIYMAEELDYSDLSVGIHVALLTLAGIASTPVLGVMSDRLGRRPVAALSMAAIGLFTFAMLWATGGGGLLIAIMLLGVFLFSINPVIVAAAMDATDPGSEGTAVAVLFAGGSLIGAIAPVIAGAVNAEWGFEGVVIFVTALASAGAILAWFAPRGRRPGTPTSEPNEARP